jgi:hypothetical protein
MSHEIAKVDAGLSAGIAFLWRGNLLMRNDKRAARALIAITFDITYRMHSYPSDIIALLRDICACS